MLYKEIIAVSCDICIKQISSTRKVRRSLLLRQAEHMNTTALKRDKRMEKWSLIRALIFEYCCLDSACVLHRTAAEIVGVLLEAN